jgi:hypothetical protein
MARRLAAGAASIRDVQGPDPALIERETAGVHEPRRRRRDPALQVPRTWTIVVLAVGLAPQGVDFHARGRRSGHADFPDPLAPAQPRFTSRTLARISRLLRTQGVVETLRRATDARRRSWKP